MQARVGEPISSLPSLYNRFVAGIITIFGNAGHGPVVGEDTVALLESIAEAFDIRYSQDDEFPKTVGKLCDLVKSRLQGDRMSKCMSSVTFYALRRAMMRTTACARQSIAPSTKLASIVSTGGQRRMEWKTMEECLSVRMPGLKLSVGVETCLGLACLPTFPAVANRLEIW